MFLSVSELFFSKIIREQKFESTPFSFGGGNVWGHKDQGTGVLNTPALSGMKHR
jgi:hypothetical protein